MLTQLKKLVNTLHVLTAKLDKLVNLQPKLVIYKTSKKYMYGYKP